MRTLFALARPMLWLTDTAYLCLLEARPVVQSVFLLRYFVGSSFAIASWEGALSLPLWMGAVAWASVTMSTYLINGIMDIKEDRINKPTRPVAQGRLPVRRAAFIAAGLALMGVGCAWYVGPYVGIGAVVALALGWLYSGPPTHLKRWPAGLAVTATFGGLLTYLVGFAANGGGGQVRDLIAFSLMLSLWMGLVGQTKDLPDEDGDRESGRRSLPVVWGETNARVAYSSAALLLGGGFALYSWFAAPDLKVSAAVLALGAITVATMTLGGWSKGDRKMRRRPYRAFMVSQYAVNVAIIAC